MKRAHALPMNYLAHLHLAKLTKTSYAGSLMADFCDAKHLNALPRAVRIGVNLHQFVDKTLDTHPLSIQFRAEQTVGRRRFAGIVQDLLMDYWLVKKWDHYNEDPLSLFYSDFLPELLEHQNLANHAYQGLVSSLDRRRWLESLGELKGIEKALMSIINRWRYGDYLIPFYQSLPQLLASSESLFDGIYPDVITAVLPQAQMYKNEGIKKASQ